ncbi:sugar ABC transporter ATP-binding protein, partial [Amorphus sp. 3PC139-8]|uniref:sugar ABC transporter ATP-binding protein n=1 Tax=Amorphus sp. 3PC139-8 TaxID=2735676 RepID=UPI00345C78D3
MALPSGGAFSQMGDVMEGAIYVATGIRKTFGPTVALDDVGFEVSRGSIVGLAGMNGAGKSTLLRIIAGATQPDVGQLRIDGREVKFASTSDALSEGVAIVSQELSLFPSLTVEENLKIVDGRGGWASGAKFRRDAEQTLSELGFTYGLKERVEGLNLAERQLVEIARALLQRPRVLILDEPTSSLHAAEVEQLHAQLRRLRDDGVGIVYVTHFLEDLLDVCDEAVVLRNGQRVESPDMARSDALPALVSAMLGDADVDADESAVAGEAELAHFVPKAGGPLTISNLKADPALVVPQLNIAPGEVYGLAGLVGSGVSDLFEVLFGLKKASSGSVTLPSGKPLQKSPVAAVRAGVAYVPSDRKTVGLMQRQTIGENVVSVRALAQGRDGWIPNRATLGEVAGKHCAELGVRMSSTDQIVSTLSGGNQQKVVFAKWLEAEPSMLLLDDPTRGIDIHARHEIHEIIRKLARSGMTILIYSSDPGEVDLPQRSGPVSVLVHDGCWSYDRGGR